jgi:hypothetical protein
MHKRWRLSLVDRFWSKVDKRPDGCWLWLDVPDVKGYGTLKVEGRRVKAHRFAYELLTGPIPEGLTLDHLCLVKPCVNPAHLEPVTARENTIRSPFTTPGIHIRQTHCKRGHPFDAENTLRKPSGARQCRTCRRVMTPIYKARYRQRLADGLVRTRAVA